MSAQQASDFIKGLEDLSAQFKTDAEAIRAEGEARKDEYEVTLEGQAKEFQQQAHDFAKDMTEFGDQLISLEDKFVNDVQALYKSIYGDTPDEPPTEAEEELPRIK